MLTVCLSLASFGVMSGAVGVCYGGYHYNVTQMAIAALYAVINMVSLLTLVAS